MRPLDRRRSLRKDTATHVLQKPYVQPREMTKQDIANAVRDYAQATINAREAGFDGVEIHAANGYLIDQFIRDGSNRRIDEYGGSVQNRLRFLIEVTEAVSEAWYAGASGREALDSELVQRYAR